ncbi:M16 family metallopeptidase [Aeromicrobium sp.]|uniref:M16 family metallopeptidase n=1 Tax=Aeromicrobium sp. TaxID=1871063 RepID=UPI002FCC6A8D
MPEILRTTHNDIPIISTEVEGPLTGSLILGVGMADEPPHLAGITHLAEHLIFRSMGDLLLAHDGVTSSHTLDFHATGTPDEVADFLNRLSSVILNPRFTEDDLRRERMVIEAERPPAFGPSAGLLTYRYGFEGAGKSHGGAPTLASLTTGEVRDWILRWFVADNARLTFTGSPPPSLAVRLPEGSVPAHRLETRYVNSPTLIASKKDGVALSLVVDENLSPWLREALDFELTSELRTTKGLIYSIDPELTNTEPGLDQVDLVLDPLEENLVETLELAVQKVRKTAENGFGQAAVDYAKSAAVSALSHPGSWAGHIDGIATTELVGGVNATPDEWIETAHSLKGDELTAALREALDTLMVAYDGDTELPDGFAEKLQLTLDEFTAGETTNAPRRGPGRRWRGNWFSVRDWLRIDDTHLHEHIFGETTSVRLDDIVVLGKFGDGSVHLIDKRGQDVIVDPILWRKGSGVIEELINRVPADHVRDFSWHDRDRTKPAE